MTVYLMMCIFLIAALVIAFYSYREFKGMFYDSMGGNNSMIPRYGGG